MTQVSYCPEGIKDMFHSQEFDVDFFSIRVYPLRKGYTSIENNLTSSSYGSTELSVKFILIMIVQKGNISV